MSDDWPGVVCRPCELGCMDCPPPERMRPWECPSCGRMWEREDADEPREEAKP